MAGWTAHPGGITLGTLTLDGFGSFVSYPDNAAEVNEDGALWGAFMGTGELMRWSREFSHASNDPPDTGLWWLEEAEFALSEGTSRIGFAQVGVDQDVHVAPVLAPLCQCFDDSLRRFGEVDLRSVQFNARNLLPDRRAPDRPFIPPLGWFRMSQGPRMDAFIAFDSQFLQGHDEAEFMTKLQGWNSLGIFDFGQVAVCPPEQAITGRTAWPSGREIVPADRGIPVSLPEWTPTSAAVAVAHVVERARGDGHAPADFAVRITRLD